MTATRERQRDEAVGGNAIILSLQTKVVVGIIKNRSLGVCSYFCMSVVH